MHNQPINVRTTITRVIKAVCGFFVLIPFLAISQPEPETIGLKDTAGLRVIDLNFAKPKQDFSIPKPRPFSFLTHVPGDLVQIAKTPFESDNLKGLAIVAAATAILVPLDQRLTTRIGKTSKQIGLGPNEMFDQVVHAGSQTLFKWPDNLNSAFYELGEGTPTMLIAGLFFISGKIEKNNRSLQTASDLLEAYISMGVTVQTLKRIAGRQAPFKATIPGGKWRPFPSFSKYQRYTTEYDAFPSGHLATMMATTTVLAQNYPEKKWIAPVGYLLTGLTAWSMVNNKVHWTGDFPLGLGIGYVAGKLAYKRHQRREEALRQTIL